ncbi:hypothetical protein MYX84_10835, partial [Acidobacteria bacterium AH-259-O06]|nr:hypothetical protein [Acidobacteria bacterium AH-259-O06]
MKTKDLRGKSDRLLEHTFFHRPEDPIPRAMNVNTLGEVPDSSWFTNRIGVRPMSLEELIRGPSKTGGPDISQPLTIIAGKSVGITPGFTLQDSRGDTYFIKFDPRAHPNLSTSADVIVTKFLYAFGYNVPENYVAYLQPAYLRIGPATQVTVEGGKKVPMTREYLEEILSSTSRLPNGSIRAVASRQLRGEPIGPFKFQGTRGDDANDIFPHEHRRELRGYRVFCAWLNHDDSRSLNTLDTYVSDGDRSYVKHHLIDFSSTLGSGSNPQRQIAPQNLRAGNEYIVEFKPLLKTAVWLGIWERPWRQANYPYPQFAEIGRLEADFFEPHDWKPEYPNPAFDRMLPEDALWAAKIVAQFSNEAIRALVHLGEYSDSKAEKYLADTLITRRDKVVRYYFRQLNPLDRFRVVGSTLEFKNLGQEIGLATPEAYEYEWFVFDNDSEELTPLKERGETKQPSLNLPESRADYLMVRIRTRSRLQPLWKKSVEVYLHTAD